MLQRITKVLCIFFAAIIVVIGAMVVSMILQGGEGSDIAMRSQLFSFFGVLGLLIFSKKMWAGKLSGTLLFRNLVIVIGVATILGALNYLTYS